MNKKFVNSILVTMLMALIFMLPMAVSAETTGTCGDDLTWVLDDAGVLIISGSGEMSDYSYRWNSGKRIYITTAPWGSDVQAVVIEEGVTSIGYMAFYGCSKLKSITFSDSITSIGGSAFYSCSKLESIIFTDFITNIGIEVFEKCPAVLYMNRNSITAQTMLAAGYDCVDPSVGRFGICGTNLTWVLSQEGVLTISGTGAMKHFSSLTTMAPWGRDVTAVMVEDGVTSIGDSAFYKCNSLTSLTLPDSLTSIGDSAFYECSSLTSLTLPDGITSIGDSAFNKCSSLTSLILPDSLASIGDSTFCECGSLTSLTLPCAITSIGDSAFYKCSSLISLTLPDGITSIAGRTFYSCSSLTNITLPNGITSVGDYAFYNCPAVLYVSRYSITAQTLQSAGYDYVDPFVGASGRCGENLMWVLSDDYVLTISGTGAMWDYPDEWDSDTWITTTPWGSDVKVVVVEEGVTSIGNNVFRNCTSLTSITLPDSITSIGDSAFYNCSATCYAYRNSSTAMALVDAGYSFADPAYPEILMKAFDRADGTRSFTVTDCALDAVSVVIPDGVTSIGDSAFHNCSSLISVTIPETVTSIGASAFYNCRSLTSIALPDSVNRIGDFVFTGCSSLASITVPDSVTNIGDYAFMGCSSLVDITIPDSVTSIGEYAFHVCSSLTSITIPDGVTRIEDATFYDCGSLTSVTLPDSVTRIGTSAFTDCRSLTSITLPAGLVSIGGSAFYNCRSLTSVTLPDGVVSIGFSAFAFCTSLTKVYLPNSVTAIDDTAFNRSVPTIYCYEDSYAQTWSRPKGYMIVLLDGKNPEEFMSITLPETLSISISQPQAIAYSVFPQLPDAVITWSSNDESVVTVADGVLTPVGSGSAIITLTVNGVSAFCSVTVVAPATSLSLPDVIYVVVNQPRQLPLTVEPAGAATLLSYTIGDSSYATISTDGFITGGAEGTTTVTVTDELTGLTAVATICICSPVTSVSFTVDSYTVKPNDVLQLTANVTMGTESCVNELVTFSSSDEKIAVVDQNGRLTAKAVGKVMITATASDTVSASCTITVKVLVCSVLPAGLVTLESEALMGIAAEGIVLPDGMQTVASRAFACCDSLMRVEIPASVTSIADDAFEGCAALTIVAPEGSVAHTFAVDHDIIWIDKKKMDLSQ